MKFTVLVAEDDAGQRTKYVELAEAAGWNVVAVENGNMAMRQLLRGEVSFDAVITDLEMGFGINGVEFLRGMMQEELMIPTMLHTSGQDYRGKSLDEAVAPYGDFAIWKPKNFWDGDSAHVTAFLEETAAQLNAVL